MQYDSDYEVRLATLAALGGNTGVTYDSVYEIDLEILRLTEQGGGGGGTGTSIDDTVTSTTKTWSSSKINNELSGKQGALTAGDNITISNGVISASQPDLSGYALSADVATELADKEDKAPDVMLSAAMGQNDILVDYSPIDSFTSGVYRIGVKIQVGPDSEIVVGYGRVVAIDLSAFVGGEAYIQYITFDAFPIEGIYMNLVTRIYRNGAWGDAVSFVRPFVDDNGDLYIPNKSTYSVDKINSLLAAKQDTLTAGTNISIENNVISASQPDLSNYATMQDLNNGLSFKQDTLTAGTGIEIVNDVISAESEIDDLHAGSATTYSSNKIIELTQGLGFDVEIVQALPQTGDAQTIYMLPKADSAATDVYDEYIYTNNAWEKIGNTQTDLSQYYTKSETDTLLGGKQTTLTAGTGIQIVDNVISATGGGGTELSAGTNISIVSNRINANGYVYNSTYHNFGPDGVGMSFTQGAVGYRTNLQSFGYYNFPSNRAVFTIGDSSSVADSNRRNMFVVGSSACAGVFIRGIGGYEGKEITGATPLHTVINGKQDTLTAGTGIQIVDNVISATGGGGQSLSAGTNISIQNDLINALGYEYDSTLNAVKMGTGLNASGNNSVVLGQYNRSRTTSSGDTIFAIGVGTGTDNANRVNAIETLSNGKTYVNGVGGYTGQGMSGTKPLDEAINDISTVANAAATIDDSASSATKAYSSQKVDQLLSGKQASLTAGDNITISNNTISAAGNVASTSVFTIWSGTQAQYDALSSHSNDVLYLIK